MSPLRRRKRQEEWDLRVRARRARLAEREREEYERERAEQERAAAADEAGPAATEPQRARRRRAPQRRRRRPRAGGLSLGGLGTASTRGARATARQAAPGLRRLSGAAGGAVARVFVVVLRLAAVVERLLIALLASLAELGRGALALAERHVTPQRGLVVVTGAAAACLVVSQFVAYRGVEVGQPQYVDVSAVAPPPQTARVDAGAAHGYVLVPLGAIALLLALVALLSGRWRLGRLISLIGVVGIAISLAIDLPKGLDAGTAGTAFAGARATMTDGFYAQLAAAAVLVLCGWALSRDLRRVTGAPQRPRRLRRGAAPARRAPSVAGGGT